MIRVDIVLAEDSLLKEFWVDGHSGFSLKGTDIVCAAASALVRTFLELNEAEPGVVALQGAEKEGKAAWALENVDPQAYARYEAWSWFLLRGLEDLAREFPDHVNIQYRRHTGRSFHGS
ncbi:MAG: ribosomal-processing cysteine protease Prp [Spirochaetales bacterium]|nr:ribosomal-processing cysteine protease Prp [Spirochaetales bacterium]